MSNVSPSPAPFLFQYRADQPRAHMLVGDVPAHARLGSGPADRLLGSAAEVGG
ncbi:MAG: hypothetical protein NTY37_06100 [Methanothrix sp.]|nr:hypothetical protein [Methanothrix sp.]